MTKGGVKNKWEDPEHVFMYYTFKYNNKAAEAKPTRNVPLLKLYHWKVFWVLEAIKELWMYPLQLVSASIH